MRKTAFTGWIFLINDWRNIVKSGRHIWENSVNFYPFKVYIFFQHSQSGNQCCLYIKYTKRITSKIKKIIAFDQRDDEFYEWGEEELTEPEIVEKGFVLQLLNNRFKAYDNPKGIRV